MPKLKHKPPSYFLHKASGQAIVKIDGRTHYLGAYGSPESHAAYRRLIAEWAVARPLAAVPNQLPAEIRADLRINELILAYLEFARGYYMKDGRPTGEYQNMKDAVRPLQALYETARVWDFGPAALRAVRERMIAANLSRKVVNARINRIRRIFKWGVERELADPAVLQGLQSVAPLKAGRSKARETDRVLPVPQDHIDAVLSHVTKPVDAMIRLQLVTGSAAAATGTYGLGTVRYNGRDLHPFGLREDEWCQHVGIFGRSGAGKTNLGFLVIHELLAKQKPLLIFDWKRNYRDLLALPGFENLAVYTIGRSITPLSFNPLSWARLVSTSPKVTSPVSVSKWQKTDLLLARSSARIVIAGSPSRCDRHLWATTKVSPFVARDYPIPPRPQGGPACIVSPGRVPDEPPVGPRLPSLPCPLAANSSTRFGGTPIPSASAAVPAFRTTCSLHRWKSLPALGGSRQESPVSRAPYSRFAQ